MQIIILSCTRILIRTIRRAPAHYGAGKSVQGNSIQAVVRDGPRRGAGWRRDGAVVDEVLDKAEEHTLTAKEPADEGADAVEEA
eukprot:CAMPEP_0194321220 /NCGR_PEP_ID=MMETSP0171-20130528/17455_1 /TAXON_ID=218684 /ORGANISM="Corethron pennatum, Strain L29A3" /LENGTH=83 /DNA_ID=CAMNT_0039079019 /DNA_START=19 /DNA_END=268 /DNA_ORIENTATION=+